MEESSEWRQGRARSDVVAEALLVVALVFAPLALGAVQLWALGVVAALAGAAALSASLGRTRAVPFPVWAAFSLCAYVGFQAIPLPHGVLAFLSPRAAELVAFTGGPGAETAARSLSLDPTATARELVRLLLFASALYAASRIAENGDGARRLGRVVAALTVVECVLIGAHKAMGTEMIYGLVTTTQANLVLGSFGNANHLAAYLTLGIPVLIAFGFRAARDEWRILTLGGAAVASALLGATASRSGAAGLFTALVVLALLLRGTLGRARRSLFLVAGFFALVAALVVFLSLTDPTRLAKFSTLLHPGRLLTDLKVRSWHDLPALISDFWATGVGRGAFEEVFPLYRHVPERLTFTHVECVLLQLPADLGLLVGGAVIVAWTASLGLAARRFSPPRRGSDTLRLAAVAALAGLSIHELGDFSLDATGAVGLSAAVLLGIAWPSARLKSRSRRGSEGTEGTDGIGGTERTGAAHGRRRRYLATGPGLAGVALLVCGGAFFVAWNGDLKRDIAGVKALLAPPPPSLSAPGAVPDAGPPSLLAAAMARHPIEPWFPFAAGVLDLRNRQPARALRDLNRALYLDPTAWAPHQAIAEALFALGRRDQSLLEFRLAYLGSRFDDRVIDALLAQPRLGDAAGLSRFAAGGEPPLLAALADSLERHHHDDDALTMTARLLAAHPDDVAALRIRTRINTRRSRFLDVLADARRLPPGDAEALLLQVRSLDALHRSDEADAFLAVALGPPSPRRVTADTARVLAERALLRHRPKDALAVLGDIDKEDLGPEDLARLHLLKGSAFEQLGRMREAVLEMVDAVRIDPSEPNRMQLGELYERRGLPREAILIYRGLLRAQRAPRADLEARVARITAEFGGNGITGGGGAYGEPMRTLRDEGNEAAGAAEPGATGAVPAGGEAAPVAPE